MEIFRWIAGVLAAVLAAASLLCFAVFVVFDVELWRGRARSLRRGVYMVLLLWFNVEVWAQIIRSLRHW